jgi:hypothetical protein
MKRRRDGQAESWAKARPHAISVSSKSVRRRRQGVSTSVPAGLPRRMTVVLPHFAESSFPAPQSVRFSNLFTRSIERTAEGGRKIETMRGVSQWSFLQRWFLAARLPRRGLRSASGSIRRALTKCPAINQSMKTMSIRRWTAQRYHVRDAERPRPPPR